MTRVNVKSSSEIMISFIGKKQFIQTHPALFEKWIMNESTPKPNEGFLVAATAIIC